MVESLKKSGFKHALNMQISWGGTAGHTDLTGIINIIKLNLSHSVRVGLD